MRGNAHTLIVPPHGPSDPPGEPGNTRGNHALYRLVSIWWNVSMLESKMKCKWHGGGNGKAGRREGGTMVFRAVVGARPDLRTAQQNYVNMRKHRDLNRGDSLHTTSRPRVRRRASAIHLTLEKLLRFRVL